MLQFGNYDEVLKQFQAVEKTNLAHENAKILESVQKIYGDKRPAPTLKDRINSKNQLLQNIEMFDHRGKQLSARGEHRNTDIIRVRLSNTI